MLHCDYSCISQEAFSVAKSMHNACWLNTTHTFGDTFSSKSCRFLLFGKGTRNTQLPGGSALQRYLSSRKKPVKDKIISVVLCRTLPMKGHKNTHIFSSDARTDTHTSAVTTCVLALTHFHPIFRSA